MKIAHYHDLAKGVWQLVADSNFTSDPSMLTCQQVPIEVVMTSWSLMKRRRNKQ